jgi:hypothetical protein
LNIKTTVADWLSHLKNSTVCYVVLFVFFAITILAFALPYCRDQGIGYVTKLLSSDFERLYERTQLDNKGEWYLSARKLYFPLKFKDSSAESSLVGERMQDQLSQIRDRERRHLGAVAFYYSRYFMAIALSSVLGVFAGALFIFISINGLKQAEPCILILFIVSSSLSAFFGLYPSLYKQPENIEDNEKLYRAYVELENNIKTNAILMDLECRQGETENRECLTKFVSEIDSRLKDINRLTVVFNPSALKDLDAAVKGIGNELQTSSKK